MVEKDIKYQIGQRRFGINWVGAYTLYLKETLRFLSGSSLEINPNISWIHPGPRYPRYFSQC